VAALAYERRRGRVERGVLLSNPRQSKRRWIFTPEGTENAQVAGDKIGIFGEFRVSAPIQVSAATDATSRWNEEQQGSL